jgi:OCT family organic cation transporter-like MFS transporter 18
MSSQRSAASGNVNNVLLTVTYLNIALYALCFQLQRPVEPFLVQQLAKDGSVEHVSRVYGQLQSFFSAVQTVGSPLVGVMLDRVGVRLASAVVFLSSALSYLLLAGATTLPMLFLSKVPTALQHAFLVAQATASVATAGDGAHPDIRAAALGRMTTAYTVGATIGPFVGGMLAERGDLYAGARVAVLVSSTSDQPCWIRAALIYRSHKRNGQRFRARWCRRCFPSRSSQGRRKNGASTLRRHRAGKNLS